MLQYDGSLLCLQVGEHGNEQRGEQSHGEQHRAWLTKDERSGVANGTDERLGDEVDGEVVSEHSLLSKVEGYQ